MEENGNVGSVTSILDTNKPVENLSSEEAGREWKEMTDSSDPAVLKRYEGMPRSAFLKRRDELWAHGPAKKVKTKETHQEETRQWLEKENQKIEDRDDLEKERKATEINIKYFGSEKESDRAIEGAIEAVAGLSEENKNFLNTRIPNSQFCWGDGPFVISLLSGISNEPDLIEAVNGIGLEKLVRLANKSGIFGRRKK